MSRVPSIRREDCQLILSACYGDKVSTDFVMSRHIHKGKNPIYFITLLLKGERKPLQLVLKISNPRWPLFKVTAEASTMRFLSEYSPGSCPRLRGFDDRGSVLPSRLGWLLMDYMPGVPLAKIFGNHEQREKFTDAQRVACLEKLADLLVSYKQFLLVSSDPVAGVAVGSFRRIKLVPPTSSNEDDSNELGEVSSVGQLQKTQPVALVEIGPDVETGLGPWRDLRTYALDLLDSRINTAKTQRSADPTFYDNYVKIFGAARAHVATMTNINLPPLPRIMHTDFGLHNVIIDPASLAIYGIIDWEWAGVAFHEVDTEDLLRGDWELDEAERQTFVDALEQRWQKFHSNSFFDDDAKQADETQLRQRIVRLVDLALAFVSLQEWHGNDKEELERYKAEEFIPAVEEVCHSLNVPL